MADLVSIRKNGKKLTRTELKVNLSSDEYRYYFNSILKVGFLLQLTRQYHNLHNSVVNFNESLHLNDELIFEKTKSFLYAFYEYIESTEMAFVDKFGKSSEEVNYCRQVFNISYDQSDEYMLTYNLRKIFQHQGMYRVSISQTIGKEKIVSISKAKLKQDPKFQKGALSRLESYDKDLINFKYIFNRLVTFLKLSHEELLKLYLSKVNIDDYIKSYNEFDKSETDWMLDERTKNTDGDIIGRGVYFRFHDFFQMVKLYCKEIIDITEG